MLNYVGMPCTLVKINIIYLYGLFLVNTKVEVRFHVDSASWIPESVRPKLHELVCTCGDISVCTVAYSGELYKLPGTVHTQWHIKNVGGGKGV